MKVAILSSLLLLFVFTKSSAQVKQDTIVLKGFIGNHFHLSSTHTVKIEDQAQYLEMINSISSKMEKLDRYYRLKAKGEIDNAEYIIESDCILAKKSQFEITYLYMMSKMEELDILFLPLIKFYGKGYIISCEINELNELDEFLNKEKDVQLTCIFLANIPMNNTIILKLIKVDK